MPNKSRQDRPEHAPQPSVRVRPSPGVRLIEEGGKVLAFPEPHRTPVLPAGWAPLSREQQDAVLAACDAAPEAAVMRLGSLWEPGAEYRVYRLASELWGGLSVVVRGAAAAPHGQAPNGVGGNPQLLGLAWATPRAVQIALDFFNWDLEAQGQKWRLEVREEPVDEHESNG